EDSLRKGRDTATVWTPVWLPMAVGLLLVLVPIGGRRRNLSGAGPLGVATI
ncbi:MAG: hypothetical protein QOJ03_1915, partial [Frankiaceae bacterium]|nr:hypothetical protein [Frankiaceae bacterium]